MAHEAQLPRAPRLLERMRTELRSRHYSQRTEGAYTKEKLDLGMRASNS